MVTAWLDLLAVQGTLKSLLQHHSSKTSILKCSAFFTVQVEMGAGGAGVPKKTGAPHERLPEILVVPREKTPTGAAARGNP